MSADRIAAERIWIKPCDPCDRADDYYLCSPEYLDGRETTYVRADLAEAQAQENARLRWLLGGVRGAIDTGRNEPLMIWRDQINIALGDAP